MVNAKNTDYSTRTKTCEQSQKEFNQIMKIAIFILIYLILTFIVVLPFYLIHWKDNQLKK